MKTEIHIGDTESFTFVAKGQLNFFKKQPTDKGKFKFLIKMEEGGSFVGRVEHITYDGAMSAAKRWIRENLKQ